MDKKTDTIYRKRVTKSIRLTENEAAILADLVENTAYSEASLMRRWVLSGMQEFRITEAIHAYQEGHIDLHTAAERAQLPVAILMQEMANRKVAIIDRVEAFGPGLEALRDAFGKEL